MFFENKQMKMINVLCVCVCEREREGGDDAMFEIMREMMNVMIDKR